MFPASLCLEFDFHSGLDSMLQRSGGSQAGYFIFDIDRGFSKYNGPFLASFTDLCRVLHGRSNVDNFPMLLLYEK